MIATTTQSAWVVFFTRLPVLPSLALGGQPRTGGEEEVSGGEEPACA